MIFNRRNRSENLDESHVLALAVRFNRLPDISALRSLGFPVGRAPPSGGLMPALESCPAWPAMFAVVAGAGGKDAASAARVADDVLGSTYQRASASDPMADLGGTSSSIATGTSGSAGFSFATTMGCGASAKVAGAVGSGVAAVVSAVTAGPKESAITERLTPIANNNANASHMMVCFIVASPEANRIKKSAVSPCPGSTAPDSFKINSGRLEAD